MPRKSPPTIDKDGLYGEYVKDKRRRNRLQREIVSKALDIPAGEDDVNIDQRRTNVGLCGWPLVAFAGIAFIGIAFTVSTIAGLLGWHGSDRLSTPATEPPAAVPAPAPPPAAQAQDFRVRFWAEDGTEIDVTDNGDYPPEEK